MAKAKQQTHPCGFQAGMRFSYAGTNRRGVIVQFPSGVPGVAQEAMVAVISDVHSENPLVSTTVPLGAQFLSQLAQAILRGEHLRADPSPDKSEPPPGVQRTGQAEDATGDEFDQN